MFNYGKSINIPKMRYFRFILNNTNVNDVSTLSLFNNGRTVIVIFIFLFVLIYKFYVIYNFFFLVLNVNTFRQRIF